MRTPVEPLQDPHTAHFRSTGTPRMSRDRSARPLKPATASHRLCPLLLAILATVLFAPFSAAQEPPERRPLEVANDYLAAYGRFDIDTLRGFWTEATVFADPTAAEIGAPLPPTRGADAIASLLQVALAGLLSPSIEYTECFHSGGLAIGIGRLRYGLSAAGIPQAVRDATFDVRVVSVLRVAGNTILEHTDYTDLSGFHERIAAAREAAVAGAFREGSLEEALHRGRQQKRPVLVLVSAPYCIACHRMDHSTWLDVRVVQWLAAHAVAVRIAPAALEAAAGRLGVHGFPTVIRFENGVERARLSGLRTADELIGWLNDPDAPKPAPTTLEEQYDRAVDLLLGPGDRAAAARALAEVWVRIGSESDAPALLRWLRRDRLPSMLARVSREEAARGEVAALLTGFPAEGPEPTAPEVLVADWLSLQQALGATASIDPWIDRMLGSPTGRACLEQQPAAFHRLVARDRLADAGRIASPRMWNYWVARRGGTPTGEGVSDAMPAEAIAKDRERAPAVLGTFLAALRAASRTAQADALEALVSRTSK
jgi:thiol-disulfide isomerase/thioredoxin